MKQPDAALAERRAAAERLVNEHAYLATAGAVYVYSDRPGVAGYSVEGGRCCCPDAVAGYAFRELGGRCKHALAAEMVQKPAGPRLLPPRDEDAWLDEQDETARTRAHAAALEEIAAQFA